MPKNRYRKRPRPHTVRSHTRKGSGVNSYNRGSGSNPSVPRSNKSISSTLCAVCTNRAYPSNSVKYDGWTIHKGYCLEKYKKSHPGNVNVKVSHKKDKAPKQRKFGIKTYYRETTHLSGEPARNKARNLKGKGYLTNILKSRIKPTGTMKPYDLWTVYIAPNVKPKTYVKAKLGKKLPYRQVYVKSVKGDIAHISWSTGRDVVEGHINIKNIRNF